MIEIEFSALTRLCLNRRIPTFTELEAEVRAFMAERDHKRIKINWQFSLQATRKKLNSHYSTVNAENKSFQETSAIRNMAIMKG